MDDSDDTEYLIRCTVCGLDEDYSGPTIVGDTICPNEKCGHPSQGTQFRSRRSTPTSTVTLSMLASSNPLSEQVANAADLAYAPAVPQKLEAKNGSRNTKRSRRDPPRSLFSFGADARSRRLLQIAEHQTSRRRPL